MIIRQCAWCKKFLGIRFSIRQWGTTHGICKKDAEKMRVIK